VRQAITVLVIACMIGTLIAALGNCGREETDTADTNMPPAGGGRTVVPGQPDDPEPAGPRFQAAGYGIGDPIAHDNLTVFPLYRIGDVDDTDYITLGEAVEEEAITIKELDNPDVPRLKVTNSGDGPVYIIGGEVLLGGKQDRICARDVIIKPGCAVEIDVHCVEQRRWTAGEELFETSGVVAGRDVRARTQFLDGHSQTDVWAQVAAANAEFEALDTTSYRGAITSEKAGAADSYLAAVEDAIAGDPEATGIAVAINGEVVVVDAFKNPKLFRKLWPKLAKSVAMDAAAAQGEEMAGEAAPEDVVAFLSQVDASDEKVRTEIRDEVGVYRAPAFQAFGYGDVATGDAEVAPADYDHLNVLAE